MISKKKFITIILSLLIIILISQAVFAIGIKGPIKYFRIYKPNDVFELEYEVISNMPSMDVKTHVEEPEGMEGSAQIDTTKFFLKSRNKKTIHISFKLPAEVHRPGPYAFWIHAEESPPKLRGGTAGAKGSIKSLVIIFVPYPGKYLTGGIESKPVKQGEEVIIDLILKNLGNESINTISSIIDIYDQEGNKIDTLQAYEPRNKNDFMISVGAEETGKMYADWMPDQELKGKFKIKASIDYDGFKTNASGTAIIGYKDIEIVNTTRTLEAGTISEYIVKLESLWNEPLRDTFTDVTFRNSTGQTIDTIRSTKYELSPFIVASFKSYWNTRKLESGQYTAQIKVYYYDGQERKQILIQEGEYPVELIPPKKPTTEKPFGFSTIMLVVISIIIILLIIGGNIFFFIYMKRKPKEEKEEPKKKGKVKKGKKSSKEDLEKAAEEELKALEDIDLD